MKNKFNIRFSATSHMGKIRTNNEDNLFLNGKYLEDKELESPFQQSGEAAGEKAVFAVCDGMGGEEFGEEASLTGVRTLADHLSHLMDKKTDVSSAIGSYVQAANATICHKIADRGKRIGTTLALVVFRQNRVSIANLGDSRIYLFRNNELKQISEDHTQSQSLIRTGVISKDEAKTHPTRNQLTQHLGIFPDELLIEPHLLIDQLVEPGDRWLLCSDGLTDLLSDAEIAGYFHQHQAIDRLGATLVDEVLNRGAHDNVTCIVLQAYHRSLFSSLFQL